MIAKDTLPFLVDLKKNNNREWFLANKKRYEAYKKNYAEIIGEVLALFVPHEPEFKRLLPRDIGFRINRDIRFSKDKSPYKTHMGLWLSAGTKNWNQAGYYIHIEKGGSFIAAGIHQPEAPELKRIRKEIAFFHDDLDKIVSEKEFKEIYGALDRDENNTLKTAPKDYEKDHPAIEYLKLKSFTATAKIDDRLLSDADFAKKIVEKLIVLKPFVAFLNRALDVVDEF
jgi:uncharacterized protein (TIGR02453 family)